MTHFHPSKYQHFYLNIARLHPSIYVVSSEPWFRIIISIPLLNFTGDALVLAPAGMRAPSTACCERTSDRIKAAALWDPEYLPE